MVIPDNHTIYIFNRDQEWVGEHSDKGYGQNSITN